MKTLQFIALFLSTNLLAQEFYPPTDEDLLNVSLKLMDESKELMSKKPQKDCDNDITVGMSREIEVKKPVEPENREIFCVCELDGLKGLKVPGKKKNLGIVLGEYVESELSLTTGNDNFLHGGLQAMGGARFDGDDRGRTFGGGIDYTLTGKEGQLRLTLDSTGFSKFAPQDGISRAPDNTHYLQFRERNTLNIRLDKNFSYEENNKTYLISEFKFVNETDSGNLSRAAQAGWHRQAKEKGLFNAIQYRYVTAEEDTYAFNAILGVGKKWVSDIGNWKCQTALEAKGGMSIDLNKSISPEVGALASAKVSHSSLPWLALSTWIQGSAGRMGAAADAGIMLSVEKKMKSVAIKTFIGVEQHNSRMDRRFASDGKSELYHVLGVTIKY